MEHHRFVDLATEVTLILTEHIVKGVLSGLGQVTRLQDALMTIHLEVGLLLSDHGLQEVGHAGLFLKTIDGFLLIVGAWTDVLLGAFARDVVD